MTVDPLRRRDHQALDHVMDARGANLAESRALVNLDTPEADSLVELIQELPMPARTRVALMRSAAGVIRLNEAEGGHELAACALLESTSGRRYRPRVKWIADQLRAPLAADWTTDGVAYAACVAIVRDLGRDTTLPPDALRGRSLAHELGDGPAGKLHELLDELDERDAWRR